MVFQNVVASIIKNITAFFRFLESQQISKCMFINTLCIWGTPKCVLLQTVKTQMKCRIMRHFIWVYTVKVKTIFR